MPEFLEIDRSVYTSDEFIEWVNANPLMQVFPVSDLYFFFIHDVKKLTFVSSSIITDYFSKIVYFNGSYVEAASPQNGYRVISYNDINVCSHTVNYPFPPVQYIATREAYYGFDHYTIVYLQDMAREACNYFNDLYREYPLRTIVTNGLSKLCQDLVDNSTVRHFFRQLVLPAGNIAMKFDFWTGLLGEANDNGLVNLFAMLGYPGMTWVRYKEMFDVYTASINIGSQYMSEIRNLKNQLDSELVRYETESLQRISEAQYEKDRTIREASIVVAEYESETNRHLESLQMQAMILKQVS